MSTRSKTNFSRRGYLPDRDRLLQPFYYAARPLSVHFAVEGKVMDRAKRHVDGRKAEQGFTLAEMLMLIAVVVVLAGLLLPPFSHSREKARRATCLGNLKSIGLSLRLYSGDNQKRWLPSDATGTTLGSFARLTNNYQTSYKTWICPSDPGVFAGASVHPFTCTNLSYAYGGFGLTESVQPDTPLVCDRSSTGNPTGVLPWQNNTWTHKSDGGNVLYADGHIAWTKTMTPPMYRGKNP